MLNQNESVKIARQTAKENGFVLRQSTYLLDGQKAYGFFNRKTNERVSRLFTLKDIKCCANTDQDFLGWFTNYR